MAAMFLVVVAHFIFVVVAVLADEQRKCNFKKSRVSLLVSGKLLRPCLL